MFLKSSIFNLKSVKLFFLISLSAFYLSAQDSTVTISKARLDSLIANQKVSKKKKNALNDSLPKFSKNSVFFEAAGRSIVYSLNYERRLSKVRKSLNTSLRVGVGYFGNKISSSRDNHNVFIPYSFNLELGPGDHKFEIAYGQTLVIQTGSRNYYSNYYDYAPYYGGYSNNYMANLISPSSPEITLNNNISFGYKRVPVNGGVYFKAYAMIWLAPISIKSSNFDLVDTNGNILSSYQTTNTFDVFTESKFIPYVGIAIGYTFKSN